MYENLEDIAFRMTECACELEAAGQYPEAEATLKSIFSICHDNMLDIPDEAEKLNIAIKKRKGE